MDNKKEEKYRKNEKKRWNNKHRKSGAKKDANKNNAHASEHEGFEHIDLYKDEVKNCTMCGQPINDLPSALADKETGEPVHFNCVLKYITEHENPAEGQSVAYIGQGRFALISLKSPSNPSQFSIERIIEWESRDKKYEWRSNIADLYSCIK